LIGNHRPNFVIKYDYDVPIMKFAFVFLFIFLLIGTSAFAAAHETDTAIPQSRAHIALSFAPIVKQITPSVVNIYTKRVVKQAAHPLFSDPFFAPFFGGDFGMGFGNSMRERIVNTLGSGVIVEDNGLIVTNAHVIEGANEIVIVMNDGREFEADISVIDKPSDIALLRMKTPPENLQAVTMKASSDLEVGDLVLAVGNPFGVGQTVTSGIVSAVARSSTSMKNFNFFIQTDAAINPGNSGGPLVAMDGSVIGINTAIYSQSGGSNGIGFAVPAEMVQTVINAEKSGQKNKHSIIRGWLGFTTQPVTGEIARSLGMTYPRGALIQNLHPQSPAAETGLKQGDVVIALNGTNVTSPQELKFRLSMVPINGTANVTVLRQNETKQFQFRVITAPEIPVRDMRELKGRHPFGGTRVVNISPAVIEELGLEQQVEDGIIVESVDPNSHARRLGIKQGDIILSVNRKTIKNTKQLQDLLAAGSRPQSGWVIQLQRNGINQQIILR